MAAKKIPMRMCIGCREMKSKFELVRIVRGTDGKIQLDLTGRLNGRGAYICKKAECLKKAAKANALSRAFAVSVPPEIYEELEKEFGDN